MRRLLTVLVSAMLFLGCSSPPAPDSSQSGEEKPSETFWQLSDDSELSVKMSPWPPSNGKVTLEANNGLGDWGNEKPIVEDLEYRVVNEAGSSAAYTKMERTEKVLGEGEEAVTEYFFTARDVALPAKSSVFVQFRASGAKLTPPVELTDWKIEIP
jgi:hypothetical protein